MQNTKDFLLELGQLNESHVTQLSASFNNLPKSNYLDGDYRLRRYSHFNFSADKLTKLPIKAFEQGLDFNTFQGNIERRYEEIEQEVINSKAFVELFTRFKDIASLDDKADIDVHQMRIIARDNKFSQVTPEGVHQDGYKSIGIFFIDNNARIGGELKVHTQQKAEPFIKHKFDKGEFVVLNDERFWHSAEDIQAIGEGEVHLDVFVLTA